MEYCDLGQPGLRHLRWSLCRIMVSASTDTPYLVTVPAGRLSQGHAARTLAGPTVFDHSMREGPVSADSVVPATRSP